MDAPSRYRGRPAAHAAMPGGADMKRADVDGETSDTGQFGPLLVAGTRGPPQPQLPQGQAFHESIPPASEPMSAGERSIARDSCQVHIRLPSQVVCKQVPAQARVGDLTRHIVDQHFFELEAAYPELTDSTQSVTASSESEIFLWEVVNGLMRPLRVTETVGAVCNTWGEGQCYLQVTSAQCRLDTNSLASLTPRRDILLHPPKIRNLIVHFCVCEKRGIKKSWNRGVLDVYDGNLVVTARSPSSNRLIFSRTLALATSDVYSLIEGHTKQNEDVPPPASYSLGIRSQLPATYYADQTDASILLSLQSLGDFSLLRNIAYTLRSCAEERMQSNVTAKKHTATKPSKSGNHTLVPPAAALPPVPSREKRGDSKPAYPAKTPLVNAILLRGNASDPLHGEQPLPDTLLGARYRQAGNPSRPSSRSRNVSRGDFSAAPNTLMAKAQEADAFRGSPLAYSTQPT